VRIRARPHAKHKGPIQAVDVSCEISSALIEHAEHAGRGVSTTAGLRAHHRRRRRRPRISSEVVEGLALHGVEVLEERARERAFAEVLALEFESLGEVGEVGSSEFGVGVLGLEVGQLGFGKGTLIYTAN